MDTADSTSSPQEVPDYAGALPRLESLGSRPLEGKTAALIRETSGAGVSPGVSAAVKRAAQHLEALGARVEEVCSLHLF